MDQRIIDNFAGPNNNLIELRTACYIARKFALLFRHDEMAQMKACHISELPEGKSLSIFIPRPKTDVFRMEAQLFLQILAEIILQFLFSNGTCPDVLFR